jgi:transposase
MKFLDLYEITGSHLNEPETPAYTYGRYIPENDLEKEMLVQCAIARWVIERSNSWMERCKILVKNFERNLSNATTKLNLCFVRLMIKRLAVAS